MDYINTLIRQVSIMFITIIIGLICKKRKVISDQFVKDLGNLLFLVINPLTIFRSFCTEYTHEKAINLLIDFGIGLLMVVIAIVLANIFFRKEEDSIENFATVINNCGFFGIPIVSAVLGQEAVFYLVPYAVINTITQYTYGAYVMSRDKKEIAFKKIITNTSIIATVLGLLFFFCRIPLLPILDVTFQTTGNLMGTMCAIIIGANLANTKFVSLKGDLNAVFVYIIRLIVIPLITILLLKYINVDEVIKLVLVITLCTPSGTSASVLARNYNKDTSKAARIVSVCSLLTIITMPLMVSLTNLIW